MARVVLTNDEVAKLVDRPAADVVGATVLVNAADQIVDAAFVLGEQGLALNVKVDQDRLLVRFDVDLSTAAGSFPSEVSQWIVRPSMCVINVEAGPAQGAFISAPSRLPAGAPASLSVQVVDANGRFVKRPFLARFVDANGRELGQADSNGSTALLQYIPEVSTPVVVEVTATTITNGGVESPGISIGGKGFSAAAIVSIDGAALVAETDFEVQGPEKILVILPASVAVGSHDLRVSNPEGLASNDISFDVN